MHGPSPQARLVEVEHPEFPVYLLESEVAGSPGEFVPTAEQPPDPTRCVPVGSGARCVGERRGDFISSDPILAFEPGF